VQFPGGPAAVNGDEILMMPLSLIGWEGVDSRLNHKPEDDFSRIFISCAEEKHMLIGIYASAFF
jgi:hypothetical protein